MSSQNKQRKQFTLHFTRVQTSSGRFKTTAKLARTITSAEKQRGLIHKAYHLKDRVTGDAPSVAKALNSINPTTQKGKVALFAAKGAYKFSKGTVKASFKTAMAAESVALFAADRISPNRQLQLKFTREKTSDGKYKTRPKLINSTDFSHVKHRGLLHRTYYLKDRVTGDTPSLTKKLKSFQPKTFKGAIGISAAKGTYKFVRFSGKAALNTALGAENLALLAGDKVVEGYTQNLKAEINNQDLAKVSLKVNSLGKALIIHSREKTRFKAEKKRLKYRKEDFKLISEKPLIALDRETGKLNREAALYKSRKKAFKALSSKSNVQKAVMKRRKQQFKAAKKEYKSFQKDVDKLYNTLEKRVKNQRKIKKLTKPHSLPVKSIGGIGSAYANKLRSADSSNDFVAAAAKTVAIAKGTHSAVKSARLIIAEHREGKFAKNVHKYQGRLKEREYRLKPQKSKKSNKKHKRKSAGETATEYIKGLVKRAVTAVKITVKDMGAKFMLVLIPVVLFFLIFGAAIMMIVSGMISQSGWILGTYTADDEQLSDAVTAYTLHARNLNQSVIQCGETNNWKKGLNAAASDTDKENIKGYKTTPEKFYYGRSSELNYEPAEFDFDPYVLWSFLTAYYYNFDEAEECRKNGKSYSPEYWEVDGETEDLLQELFNLEYSFEHYYTDSSHWEELSDYNVLPNNEGGREGTYYTIYYDFSHSAFRYRKVPNEIKKYAKDGWVHYDENTLEILNANDNDKRTGWFLQDQRCSIGSRISFYCINQYGQYYCYGTDRERTPCSWSDGREIWFCVSPWDSYDFNDSFPDPDQVDESEMVCLVSFYQKKVWKKEAALYYNVKSNCAFREAVEQMLSNTSHAQERLEYFVLLVGDADKNYRGNHQCLNSPVSASMSEIIESGLIYNGYGYDVVNWNSTHCAINHDAHNALDISCSVGENIYAMIDGEVTDVSNNSVTVLAEDFELVYSNKNKGIRKYEITVTIHNVSPCVVAGDTVTVGKIIGTATDLRQCNYADNSDYPYTYVHISVGLKRLIGKPIYIAPELLIY